MNMIHSINRLIMIDQTRREAMMRYTTTAMARTAIITARTGLKAMMMTFTAD